MGQTNPVSFCFSPGEGNVPQCGNIQYIYDLKTVVKERQKRGQTQIPVQFQKI